MTLSCFRWKNYSMNVAAPILGSYVIHIVATLPKDVNYLMLTNITVEDEPKGELNVGLLRVSEYLSIRKSYLAIRVLVFVTLDRDL